jgi:hypothetical protein
MFPCKVGEWFKVATGRFTLPCHWSQCDELRKTAVLQSGRGVQRKRILARESEFRDCSLITGKKFTSTVPVLRLWICKSAELTKDTAKTATCHSKTDMNLRAKNCNIFLSEMTRSACHSNISSVPVRYHVLRRSRCVYWITSIDCSWLVMIGRNPAVKTTRA